MGEVVKNADAQVALARCFDTWPKHFAFDFHDLGQETEAVVVVVVVAEAVEVAAGNSC